MWDLIGVIGLLVTFVAIIGSIVLGIKKNVLWKKWLSAAGIAFVVCIIGAANAPTNTNNKSAITAPPTQQQTQSQPAPQSQPQPQTGQQPQPEQQPQTEQAKTSASQVQVQSEQQSAAKAATPPPQSTAPAKVKTPAPQAQKQDTTVYITRTGKKYHRDGCRYLSKSKIPISLSDAKSAGYDPCSVCDPPY